MASSRESHSTCKSRVIDCVANQRRSKTLTVGASMGLTVAEHAVSQPLDLGHDARLLLLHAFEAFSGKADDAPVFQSILGSGFYFGARLQTGLIGQAPLHFQFFNTAVEIQIETTHGFHLRVASILHRQCDDSSTA